MTTDLVMRVNVRATTKTTYITLMLHLEQFLSVCRCSISQPYDTYDGVFFYNEEKGRLQRHTGYGIMSGGKTLPPPLLHWRFARCLPRTNTWHQVSFVHDILRLISCDVIPVDHVKQPCVFFTIHLHQAQPVSVPMPPARETTFLCAHVLHRRLTPDFTLCMFLAEA